ncbi:uncharacterized protein LOC130828168 [Amaranthus tricolor]|uniref:uncharacterized protein LOC130828168 n=1 Tax=Amaranthus tricolor TaxID=29722 RepID=UPI00258FB530|nr:uncharacterized protein LOC130828168 [Amaranthus tricolor]
MKRSSSALMMDSTEFLPPAHPNNWKKKTRDLPNLSDCHCCNHRINSSNPKNRLLILGSEWRIVLLCKRCYNLVESAQYCSYCLSRVLISSIESFKECKRCHRRIHKDCISMVPLGSGNINGYSCSNNFFLCFDCWMPKLLENEYNIRVSKIINKKRPVKIGGEKIGGETTNSLGSSGVCDSQDKGKGLEDAANDVNVVAQMKIGVVLEANEKAINKAMAAKKVVAFTSSGVGIVSMDKDKNGQRAGSVVDDDAQLAIRLHRAINSSPRISRYSCLLNTQSVDIPEANGNVGGLESWVGVETSCAGKLVNIGGDEQNRLCETRQECEQNCTRAQNEKCGEGSGAMLITYSRKARASLEVKEEHSCSGKIYSEGWSSRVSGVKEEAACPLRTYRRKLSKNKRYKLEIGHCYKTYSRKRSIHGKSKLYGSPTLDNGTLTPSFALNHREESLPFTAAL